MKKKILFMVALSMLLTMPMQAVITAHFQSDLVQDEQREEVYGDENLDVDQKEEPSVEEQLPQDDQKEEPGIEDQISGGGVKI